MVQITILCEY